MLQAISRENMSERFVWFEGVMLNNNGGEKRPGSSVSFGLDPARVRRVFTLLSLTGSKRGRKGVDVGCAVGECELVAR